MNPLLMVPLALGIGFMAARIPAIPRGLPRLLNRAVIWVLLPSLTFVQIHHLAAETDAGSLLRFALPVSMAWLLFLTAAILFSLLGRYYRWKRESIGALILTAGLGNTAFIGYPLIQSLYGEQGIRIAILTDQPGSFLVFSILGVITATLAAGTASHPRQILTRLMKRILTFPSIYALIIAISTRHLNIPDELLRILSPAGKMMTAAALLSVGFQWNPRELLNSRETEKIKAAALGLGFKLALIPAIFLGIYSNLGVRGLDLRVIVLESAMAPMVTAGILATESGLDHQIVLLMVGAGLPLSFLTLPLWIMILHQL